MGTLNEDLTEIKRVEDTLTKNKVSRFAYTEEAYNKDHADGVSAYNIDNDQNIPIGTADIMKVNQTVIDRGYRAQASSITRMLLNHFLGRLSYNLNKVNDNVSSLLATLQSHLGKANGIASLDENGRVPYSQLPESAMELKGEWDASTNTPELVDGTGTNGDFYVVTVAGTQTFGGKSIKFQVNDRILYNGSTSTWIRLQAGGVYSVNNIEPDATGNINLESLSINGQNFNGSAPVTVDTMKMLYGGTGATDAKGAEFNITAGMESQTSDFTDTTKITCVQESPSVSNGRFFYSNASYLWNYIKGKISSVLGLTKDTYGGKASTAGTADKATNDSNGNNIVNTYALKSNLQYTKSINISKVNGSSNTWYHLIAKTPSPDSIGNIDSLFVNGSDFMNRMFEGSIKTRDGNSVYNYGKNNLPIELYKQTDGTIYVYWLVSDAYNKVALNITATMSITIYGGYLSPVTPTGSKMTLTEYDYKSYEILPIERGGTGNATGLSAKSSFLNEYLGAGSTRLASGNIVPKDSSEYGGMRKDIVSSSMTDSGRPGMDGHILTMFWDGDGRWDNQLFISNDLNAPQILKVRQKQDKTDYGPWIDIITSNNIGSQTVSKAGNATTATNAYSGMVYTCSNHYATKEKTVSIPGFTLTKGVCIRVLFINGNSATRPTLNVNDTGAKEICGPYGVKLDAISTPPNTNVSGSGICTWDHKIVLDLYYDGIEWRVIDDPIVQIFSENSTVHKSISMLGNLQTSILH